MGVVYMSSKDVLSKAKAKTKELIESGEIEFAKELIEKYKDLLKNDVEVYSMRAIIAMIEGKMEEAEQILLEGYKIDNSNFDLLYNLGYLYESMGINSSSLSYYKRAKIYCDDIGLDKELENKIDNLEEYLDADRGIKENQINKKKKIVFFVKRGLDNFLTDIIDSLSKDYEVKKIIIENNDKYNLIDQWMEWADVCWFEWCDELVIYGSSLPIAREVKIICRLHRYEVFTNYPQNVNWYNVDKLIIVTEHLKSFLSAQIPDIEKIVDIITVNNGVNLKNYKFKERKKGFNIAYVGYINQRKNPVLLLQIISKLVKIDKRYKLYVAGQFQDGLIKLYWNYQIRQMELQDNVIFEGWQDDISKWLEDKNYLISTSMHESFGYGIAEAMARGLKPVIHDFIMSEEVWPNKYLFCTVDEAVKMITCDKYNSKEYRKFIEDNYSLNMQINKIKEMLITIVEHDEKVNNNASTKKIYEIVQKIYSGEFTIKDSVIIKDLTIVIPTYNRAIMLHQDLKCGLKLGDVPKIIVDDGSNPENKKVLNEILARKEEFNIEKMLFSNENKGVAFSCNKGISQVKTKATLLLGDDDCLITLDRNHEINQCIVDEFDDILVIIPRYVFNLYNDGKSKIGYDRKAYNDMMAEDILKKFALTGEILAFNAGAIFNAQKLKAYSVDDFFRVGEDHVMLARLFANNRRKKVKVLESYVYIRRIDSRSLTGSTNKEKIFIHLVSLLVSSYYCLQYRIISKEMFFHAFENRISLLNNVYGFGRETGAILQEYLTRKIDLNFLIKKAVDEKIVDTLKREDLPIELIEIINYL